MRFLTLTLTNLIHLTLGVPGYLRCKQYHITGTRIGTEI